MGDLSRGIAITSPYYQTLADGIRDVATLTDEGRTAFLTQAEVLVADVVMPAYRRLADKLNSQRFQAPQAIGVGSQPEGLAYYDYLLRHQTQTTLSADAIHSLGLAEVARIHGEIRELAAQVEIEESAPLATVFREAANAQGSLLGVEHVAENDRLISNAWDALEGIIDTALRREIVVVSDATGLVFVPGSKDGTRPAYFHVTTSSPAYKVPSLAYHEAVPGHHLQISYAQQLDLPLMRTLENYLGHTEGWALYAERLASELGWYQGNPYGDLGRLQMELLRAVRVVLDTGIHALGWEHDDAVDYFVANTGFSSGYGRYEVGRYAVYPAQAVSYTLGLLKILEMRTDVQTALGDGYDSVAFHDVILGGGSMPLMVLEDLVRRTLIDAAD